ncbi:MAG: N-acyl homoserine lactonase family protein [Pseudomonadota bacterium]|nr:N-acyl homoserine lactonase family protein [Pseudomonadota bacterium]
MSECDVYEVYAVCYAVRRDRMRRENYIASGLTDPVHDQLEPLAYFVWALRNDERTIVVDTGFDEAEAERRHVASGKVWTCDYGRSPADGLKMIGIDSREVNDVIVTHLHYDHAGTLYDFPKAQFHLQETEVQYATGPHMTQGFFSSAYTVDHVVEVVRNVFQRRVVFHQGDSRVAPGVTVHHIGGHTMGIQCVRVKTQSGWLVLASDASHFYGNFEDRAPFPIVYNVADMLRGFERLETLAGPGGRIIPGHDPLVLTRYPTWSSATEDIVVRLDVD